MPPMPAPLPAPVPFPGGRTAPNPSPAPMPAPSPGTNTATPFPLTFVIPKTGQPSPYVQLFDFHIDMRWIVALIFMTWSVSALEGYNADYAWALTIILLIGIAMFKDFQGFGGKSLKPSTKKGYQ